MIRNSRSAASRNHERRQRRGRAADAVFLGSSVVAADLTTYTFSNMALGSPDPARMIVVAGAFRSATAVTIASVTVGGVPAAVRVESRNTLSGVSSAFLASAIVPDGATGDVVLTLSDVGVRAGVALFSSTKQNSPIPTKTGTATRAATAGTMSPDLTAPDIGFQIAVAFSAATNHFITAAMSNGGAVAGITVNCTAGASAWTGLTEVVDTLLEAGTAGPMAAVSAGWKT